MTSRNVGRTESDLLKDARQIIYHIENTLSYVDHTTLTSYLEEISTRKSQLQKLHSEDSKPVLNVLDALSKNVHVAIQKCTRQDGENTAFTDCVSVVRGGIGRPSKQINNKAVKHFMSAGFSLSKIARDMKVSRSCLYKNLRPENIKARDVYTSISDDQLDAAITKHSDFNNRTGYRMMTAKLKSQGIVVPSERVRITMARLNPKAAVLRLTTPVPRRVYRVANVNSLWHFDSNHKLINTDNKAATAFGAFKDASDRLGVLPSRTRSDRGSENSLIIQFMRTQRGFGRSSAIVGKSVHNQRIERLWVDIFKDVLCVFQEFFVAMEERGILDPSDDLYLFCLHYAFLPCLQFQCDLEVETWNKHRMSSEHNKTPEMLYIEGVMSKKPTYGISEYFLPQHDPDSVDSETYGVDEASLTREDTPCSEKSVEVPDTRCPLTADKYAELLSTVPNKSDGNLHRALDVYMKSVNFVLDNE